MKSRPAPCKTSRIRLGPAVAVGPLYEPIRLLEDIGLADQLSDGRLVLGFGTGDQEYEFKQFGRDLEHSRAVLLETFDFLGIDSAEQAVPSIRGGWT